MTTDLAKIPARIQRTSDKRALLEEIKVNAERVLLDPLLLSCCSPDSDLIDRLKKLVQSIDEESEQLFVV